VEFEFYLDVVEFEFKNSYKLDFHSYHNSSIHGQLARKKIHYDKAVEKIFHKQLR
jgi:hypothetical protein